MRVRERKKGCDDVGPLTLETSRDMRKADDPYSPLSDDHSILLPDRIETEGSMPSYNPAPSRKLTTLSFCEDINDSWLRGDESLANKTL
jgi:hypothetical protein